MKRWRNYLIIESQDDFLKYYNPNWGGQIEHNNILSMPAHYPICYHLNESYPGCCGTWVECDFHQALNEWREQMRMYQKLIRETKKLFYEKKEYEK